MARLPKGVGVWTERLPDLGVSPEALAGKAAWAGLGHVAVKNADSQYERDHDLIRKLSLLLRGRHIELWVWPYAGYSWSSVTGGEEGRLHARFALSVGAVGVIPDIEPDDKSVKYYDDPDNARAYIRGLRETGPNLGLGVTSYWHKQYHPKTPWEALLEHAFNAPQVYWTVAHMDPANMLVASLKTFGNLGMPAYPLGGDAEAGPLTGEAVRDFAAACQGKGLTSWGLYHWGGRVDWDAIKQVCAAPALPTIRVMGPAGEIACNPAVAENRLWVDLGALLPVLAQRELHFASGDPAHPARCLLREVAEAFGWRVDTSAWPTVKVAR